MSKEYKINHSKAWAYFVYTGALPADAKKNEWCLHHVDTTLKYTNPDRYNEWRVEDLQPMLKSEHTRLHWKDRRHSDETKAKISAALKGHEVSEDTRAKISAGCAGKPSWLKGTHGLVTPWNKGRTNCYSEETLRKISEGNRGRAQSSKERRKRAASVAKAWRDETLREKQAKRVSNSIWINNGDVNRRISNCAEIPEGWSKGRLGGWSWKTSRNK